MNEPGSFKTFYLVSTLMNAHSTTTFFYPVQYGDVAAFWRTPATRWDVTRVTNRTRRLKARAWGRMTPQSLQPPGRENGSVGNEEQLKVH
jgi:hypothetical protein